MAVIIILMIGRVPLLITARATDKGRSCIRNKHESPSELPQRQWEVRVAVAVKIYDAWTALVGIERVHKGLRDC